MATVTGDPDVTTGAAAGTAAPTPAVPPAAGDASGAVDWTVVLLGAWVAGGAYLDAWAHDHRPAIETFLTPWHGFLYSGMAATTAFLVLLRRRRRAAGRPWQSARGYGLSLTGCLLFLATGVVDAVWHTAFGFERGVTALVSPPHVLLTVSAGLIFSGPLRVAWSRPGRDASWPAVLSATLLLSGMTYLTQFDHPLIHLFAAGASPSPLLRLPVTSMELGVLGIIVQTACLSAVGLLLVARFRLPPGALAVLVGANGLMLVAAADLSPLVLVAVAMGALGDLLVWVLQPSPDRLGRFRLFAAVWPAAAYSVYFLELWSAYGVWWPVHVWTGSILIAATCGWLVSHLVLPERPALATPD